MTEQLFILFLTKNQTQQFVFLTFFNCILKIFDKLVYSGHFPNDRCIIPPCSIYCEHYVERIDIFLKIFCIEKEKYIFWKHNCTEYRQNKQIFSIEWMSFRRYWWNDANKSVKIFNNLIDFHPQRIFTQNIGNIVWISFMIQILNINYFLLNRLQVQVTINCYKFSNFHPFICVVFDIII